MPPKKSNTSRKTRNAKNMAKNYAKEGVAEKHRILMALRKQQKKTKTEKIALGLQQAATVKPKGTTGTTGTTSTAVSMMTRCQKEEHEKQDFHSRSGKEEKNGKQDFHSRSGKEEKNGKQDFHSTSGNEEKNGKKDFHSTSGKESIEITKMKQEMSHKILNIAFMHGNSLRIIDGCGGNLQLLENKSTSGKVIKEENNPEFDEIKTEDIEVKSEVNEQDIVKSSLIKNFDFKTKEEIDIKDELVYDD
jgi:hypothetical protein